MKSSVEQRDGVWHWEAGKSSGVEWTREAADRARKAAVKLAEESPSAYDEDAARTRLEEAAIRRQKRLGVTLGDSRDRDRTAVLRERGLDADGQ